MTDETICYMKYNNPTGSLISAIKYTLFLDFGFSYSLYLFVKVLLSLINISLQEVVLGMPLMCRGTWARSITTCKAASTVSYFLCGKSNIQDLTIFYFSPFSSRFRKHHLHLLN